MFKNKVIIFVATRYFSYLLQFLNSLLVAYILGPYFMGIWGFLALMLQYLNFGNFGIDIALNVTLSTGDLNDNQKQSKIVSNAIMATVFTSVFYLLIGLIINITGISFFDKYMFPHYMILVLVISCLNYFNVLLLNIFRTYSLFTPISIFQTIIQLLQLPMLFVFKGSDLILSLLMMMILAHIISLAVFLKKLPVKISVKLDSKIMGNLYKRGLSLLSYALTFYLLLLSTRSMVGYYFPVETMGLFSFSASIASALIVGLSSLEFVLFPKMLNRLSSNEITEKSILVFKEVRYIYTTTAFLAVILGLICYPLLLIYFKDYKNTETVFSYLVICQIIISSGFGYSTLIISKGQEFFLVIHGLIALGINLIISTAAVYFFQVDYSTLAFTLIFSFVYYDFQVIRKGRALLKMENNFTLVTRDLLSLKSLLVILLMISGILTQHYLLFYALSLVAFIILNYKGFQLVKKYAIMLFHKPSVVNINND